MDQTMNRLPIDMSDKVTSIKSSLLGRASIFNMLLLEQRLMKLIYTFHFHCELE